MNNMRYFSVAVFLFLFGTRLALSAPIINEIMYDVSGSDKDREWVEVWNNTGQAVDFSSYRFFEGEVNHKIKPVQGGATLPPSSFAVIASNPEKFLADWPQFSGALFESSFSLKNSGETIALKDKELKTIDEVVYSSSLGATGDGNSLQRFDVSWQATKPTPGRINAISPTALKPTKSDQPPPLKTQSENTKTALNNSSKLSNKAAGYDSNQRMNGFLKWGIVIAGVLIVGVTSFFLSPKKKASEADKITIIE